MPSAFQQAKDMLANKLDQWTQTVVNSQKPGGLISPVPQEVGKTYNTNKPVLSKIKNWVRPAPQQRATVAQQPPEQWWDSTKGAKMKQFDNKEDYEAAKKWLLESQGGTYTPPSPTPTPAANPQGQVLGLQVRNPKAKFVASQGRPNIDPKVQNFLETQVFPITREYGIPDAVAAGQFAAEGRFQGLGADRNNFYNINAVDHNPNLAYGYDSPQAGVEAYADLLKRRYGQALKQQTPLDVIRMIEELGYAGDPTTYGNRADNGYNSYADFIQNVPEYRYYLEQ